MPTICSAPTSVMSIPARLRVIEVLQNFFKVGKKFSSFIFFAVYRLSNRVTFQVQNEFARAITTPMQLREKPDAQTAPAPGPRTVFANTNITPEMTDRMIWNHQDIQVTFKNVLCRPLTLLENVTATFCTVPSPKGMTAVFAATAEKLFRGCMLYEYFVDGLINRLLGVTLVTL